MKFNVTFTNLGRNKANFSVTSDTEPDYDFLYIQAKKHILSDGIEFVINSEDSKIIKGGVYVGGFRNVGEFEIRELVGG